MSAWPLMGVRVVVWKHGSLLTIIYEALKINRLDQLPVDSCPFSPFMRTISLAFGGCSLGGGGGFSKRVIDEFYEAPPASQAPHCAEWRNEHHAGSPTPRFPQKMISVPRRALVGCPTVSPSHAGSIAASFRPPSAPSPASFSPCSPSFGSF